MWSLWLCNSSYSKSNSASKNWSVKLLTDPWFIPSVCSNTLIPNPFANYHNTMAICFHTGIALEASKVKAWWVSNRVTIAQKVVRVIQKWCLKEL